MDLKDQNSLRWLLASYQPNTKDVRRDVAIWVGVTGAGKSTAVSVQTGADFQRDAFGHLVRSSSVPTPATARTLHSRTLHPATFPDHTDRDLLHVDTGGFFDTRGPLFATWTANAVAAAVASAQVLQAVVVTIAYTTGFPHSRADSLLDSWENFAFQMQSIFPSSLVPSKSTVYFLSKAIDAENVVSVTTDRLKEDVANYLTYVKKKMRQCGVRLQRQFPCRVPAAMDCAARKARGGVREHIEDESRADEVHREIKKTLNGVDTARVPLDNPDMIELHRLESALREMCRFGDCLQEGRVVLSDPFTFSTPDGCSRQRMRVAELVRQSEPLHGPYLTAAIARGDAIEFQDLLALAAQEYIDPLKDLTSLAEGLKRVVADKADLLQQIDSSWAAVKENRLRALRGERENVTAEKDKLRYQMNQLRNSERKRVISEEKICRVNSWWLWAWGRPVVHEFSFDRDIPIFSYEFLNRKPNGAAVTHTPTWEKRRQKVTITLSSKSEIDGPTTESSR
uniref:Uncharacterized protein n=1 Tax=Chromera velia CCMP2878 TaxID=1169474 RepID=A0A0G4IBV4_9ALVE|eukprot:Cvel_12949.t1-p1 / transcript=Cvel_12949.t1 / gene=Cvel_12949 / organism=Chromera_velia_CCMP2878 / gene_product=hypothetical protein / transcript_product=hypothetical protein / location=Cvel_scaffold866:49899-51738(+) / protein_length=509 / sequence_SO=supercontig / SO=protein_coding / is_pseudo=false